MYHRCSSRAQLVEPTRGTRMLPYAETFMPRWKKLTADSMPAPLHFSNFEESVLDRITKSSLRGHESLSPFRPEPVLWPAIQFLRLEGMRPGAWRKNKRSLAIEQSNITLRATPLHRFAHSPDFLWRVRAATLLGRIQTELADRSVKVFKPPRQGRV